MELLHAPSELPMTLDLSSASLIHSSPKLKLEGGVTFKKFCAPSSIFSKPIHEFFGFHANMDEKCLQRIFIPTHVYVDADEDLRKYFEEDYSLRSQMISDQRLTIKKH